MMARSLLATHHILVLAFFIGSCGGDEGGGDEANPPSPLDGAGGWTEVGGPTGTGGVNTISGTGGTTGGSAGDGPGNLSTETIIEEGELGQCHVDGVTESTHAGFSGSGYLNTDNELGAAVEWVVNVGEAGAYSLEITYANETAMDRPGDISIDGMIAAAGVSFPSTSSWTNYETTTVEVALETGANRIVLQATDSAGLSNIDSLKVSGAAVSAASCEGDTGAGGTGTGGSATGGDTGTDGYPLGNPAVPSSGCNQSPTLSSGTHAMNSAGLDREYILELPDSYDSSKPHRLVFGMHWMGGSAEAVQGWSEWFHLKELDTEDSTIWVAPQGYTDGWPWRGSDDRDHTFFEELYEAIASDLCVDSSRVFSVGFSFGAMYTNALAQDHQEMLRGVVVYATADYNIHFPENTGKPLAYMGVHGIDDPTCPLDSGRRSKDRFVENNGCEATDSVPEAKQGGSHVIYDHDCPSNYPVRWVTFDGAHTYPPNNNGDWVHPVAWEFISQF